jgi:chorismate mutase
MKRPYQILTNAAITAVVFTAIPSFAAQVPAAVPAKEISLNYVSPLMKAIQLENELERSARPPFEAAMQTQPTSEVNRASCF